MSDCSQLLCRKVPPEGGFNLTVAYMQQLFATGQTQQSVRLFSTPIPDAILHTADSKERNWLAQLRLIFKPHQCHTVDSKYNDAPSLETYLQDYYGSLRLPPESGLLQRLDYGTAGLLLQSPDLETHTQLRALQTQGRIKKFYGAWSPVLVPAAELPKCGQYPGYFRSHGPKGREVRIVKSPNPTHSKKRPLVGPYRTRIEHAYSTVSGCYFAISLRKGFRHQVRAQLAQLGFPLCNDDIYLEAYPPFSTSCASSASIGPKAIVPRKIAPRAVDFPYLGLFACALEIRLEDYTLQFSFV
ncbi:pseudouridine synthase [Candidatus Haliotispira prima]|uniref:Pseudouridine synthase n=1 Tax=Candidatus Haliotispira prima TaxID=3034016 RepID=A0ABY8MG83_9SPIO|nr:pseudouridine synthase [Candidatus Haliotispira prima]